MRPGADHPRLDEILEPDDKNTEPQRLNGARHLAGQRPTTGQNAYTISY